MAVLSAHRLIGRRISWVWRVSAGFVARFVGCIIRLAFGLTLELVFFFALFSKLFLALFVSVIGSCHCVLS